MENGNAALQVVQDNQAALFDTSKPEAVIEKAQGIARRLTDIVEKSTLYATISNGKYVKVEGWTTMLAMLGVFPHVEHCTLDVERAKEGGHLTYSAKVVLKTINGQTVGSGEAICSSGEANWSNRDEFAIKSMAQTRATGKAARNSFSWIMALAGYEATPAEEMPHEDNRSPAPQTPAKSSPTASSDAQVAAAEKAFGDLYTSSFTLSDPLKSKKGTFYRKAFDKKQNIFYVWDDTPVSDLQIADGREVTVKLEGDNGFKTIKEVLTKFA